MNEQFRNPNHLTPAEALALLRAESGGNLDALPPTVVPIDTPAGTFYDRSNVIMAARHAAGLALRDAALALPNKALVLRDEDAARLDAIVNRSR